MFDVEAMARNTVNSSRCEMHDRNRTTKLHCRFQHKACENETKMLKKRAKFSLYSRISRKFALCKIKFANIFS